jgi:hypothetical protein
MTRVATTRLTALMVLALVLVAAPRGLAGEMSNLDLASRIFLKILLLDRELASKTSNHVVVGVIGSDAAHRAFSALRGQRLDQSQDFVLSDVVRYDSLSSKSRRPTVIYVGADASPEEVTAFTRKYGVLSVTTVAEYLERGVSVGLSIEDGKPRVVLNLINSDHEGLRWNSKMLKISRVVR